MTRMRIVLLCVFPLLQALALGQNPPSLPAAGEGSQHVAAVWAASLRAAWWIDRIDADGDGFQRSATLVVDWTATDAVAHSVTMKVYGRVSGTSTYAQYATTGTFTITGNTVSDTVTVAVGSPNAELPHNVYDVRVVLFDGLTQKSAADGSNDADLAGQQFETSAQDPVPPLVYSFHNAWWSKVTDADGDGYARSARLTVDWNVNNPLPHPVVMKVYTKLASAATYVLYASDSLTIAGSGDADSTWVDVGWPNAELNHGVYDVKVELYDGASLVASADQTSDTDLGGRLVEPRANDPAWHVQAPQVHWSRAIDYDGDGFAHQAMLTADWNADDGAPHTVFMKVYARTDSGAPYKLCTTTRPSVITGASAADSIQTRIGWPGQVLPHHVYDFKVELCDSMGFSTTYDSLGALLGRSFETVWEDTVGPVPFAAGGPASAGRNSDFWVDVTVGDSTHPVSDLELLSFIVDFDYRNLSFVTHAEGAFFSPDTTTVALSTDHRYLNALVSGPAMCGAGCVVRLQFHVLSTATTGVPATFSLVGVHATDSRDSSVILHRVDYQVQLVDSTASGVGEGHREIPAEFALLQNYPNPFNPATTIRFALPRQELVTLKVFNALGEVVRVLADRQPMNPGIHDCRLDARGLASGVYFYRLTAGVFTETRKLVLVR